MVSIRTEKENTSTLFIHSLLGVLQDPYMVNYKQRRENEDKKSPEETNEDFNRAFFDDANFQALFTEFQTQQAAFDDNLISSVGPKDQERCSLTLCASSVLPEGFSADETTT